jgi:hypothetical protein
MVEMEEDKKFRDILTSDVLFKPTLTPIYCRKCGTRLKVYYAEERVCAVKCGYCEYIGIVKANNPMQAAFYFGGEKENE